MKWIGIIFSILAKGLEAWNNYQASKRARAEIKGEEYAKTIEALKARDSVNSSNADELLKPPSER
jgi:predicted negative regulator of RcsB-dependent stress response